MSENELKLKPCPFCGGKAAFIVTGNIGRVLSYEYGIEFEVSCDSCGANRRGGYKIRHMFLDNGTSKIVEDDRKQAVKEWNSRV